MPKVDIERVWTVWRAYHAELSHTHIYNRLMDFIEEKGPDNEYERLKLLNGPHSKTVMRAYELRHPWRGDAEKD